MLLSLFQWITLLHWELWNLWCRYKYWKSSQMQCNIKHGAVVKNPSANAGDARDVCLIPALRRSPKVWNGNPLQYSCLENSMDGGSWWATVHEITRSQTQLNTHNQNYFAIQMLGGAYLNNQSTANYCKFKTKRDLVAEKIRCSRDL